MATLPIEFACQRPAGPALKNSAMTGDQIRDLLHASPFVPFTVHVAAEEKSYEVPHPDFAMLT
jgi:hypothetical protein